MYDIFSSDTDKTIHSKTCNKTLFVTVHGNNRILHFSLTMVVSTCIKVENGKIIKII